MNYARRSELSLILEETDFHFVGDEAWCTKVAFLADLFEHLNNLNSSLQGGDQNILTSSNKVMVFQDKVTLRTRKLGEGNLLMFRRTAVASKNIDAVSKHQCGTA